MQWLRRNSSSSAQDLADLPRKELTARIRQRDELIAELQSESKSCRGSPPGRTFHSPRTSPEPIRNHRDVGRGQGKVHSRAVQHRLSQPTGLKWRAPPRRQFPQCGGEVELEVRHSRGFDQRLLTKRAPLWPSATRGKPHQGVLAPWLTSGR